MQDSHGIPDSYSSTHSSREGIQIKGKKPAEEAGPAAKGLRPKRLKYWSHHFHLIFHKGTEIPGSIQKLTLLIAAINWERQSLARRNQHGAHTLSGLTGWEGGDLSPG